MTDITALAQREKFEAWAEHACAAPWGYLKKRRTTEGYSEQIYTCMWTAWKAASAELVEALEKAQTKNALVAGGIEAAAKPHERIAEPESRTVTVKLLDCDLAAVQHMSGGSKDYCNGFVDGTQNAIRAMRSAGVDVREAE
ncbi:hypothetical protein RRW91_17495 [Klebsiella grimontii]|uniref:hypothetical protein n=1 Tax=Klebsiella grimontii TaxID=2058152 RepID=UPI0028DA717D|nr:hypothetical protein [Klebsiella grimontii]MDT8624870.1 hypothetical protein [Klebsiella grimontii]